MNDGTTAIQVSPVTEEDTMKLASLFQRASQAIVDASTMPKEIESLKSEVDKLQTEFKRSQDHAAMLDQQLIDMRQQRNEAEDSLAQAKLCIETMEKEVQDGANRIQRLTSNRDHLQADLTQTRKERDAYGMEAMQVKDDLAKAQDTLHDFKERISALFPAQPTPPPAQPEPQPAPEVVQTYHPEPAPALTYPEPAQPAEDHPSPPANQWDVPNPNSDPERF